MKVSKFCIFLIGVVSFWSAIAQAATENASLSSIETQLSLRLEQSLAFCSDTQQRKGCKAAFSYLEEISESPGEKLAIEKRNDFSIAHLTNLRLRLETKSISKREWASGAFNAWLLSIDPHARLSAVDESDRSANADKIFVQGAGAKLRFHKGKVFVGYAMDGSAAEKAGLKAGDRILILNNRNLDKMRETSQKKWLARSKSPYSLIVERAGKRISIKITERKYYLANVETRISRMSQKVEGVIRVRSFDKDNTCSDIRLAIKRVLASDADIIRLDLRDNPGGLVREAQCAAGLFLGPGKIFARLRRLKNTAVENLIPTTIAGKNYGDKETTLETDGPKKTSLPLVVEVNQNSASAAEMLAAALQDNSRAKIIGVRSFGKGSMQSVFHPWNDARLYLTHTTHLIRRPSGSLLQFTGVTPDVVTQRHEGDNFPRERELTL